MSIGFIGAGQMARALASGFVRGQRVASQDVWAADCAAEASAHFLAAVPGRKSPRTIGS